MNRSFVLLAFVGLILAFVAIIDAADVKDTVTKKWETIKDSTLSKKLKKPEYQKMTKADRKLANDAWDNLTKKAKKEIEPAGLERVEEAQKGRPYITVKKTKQGEKVLRTMIAALPKKDLPNNKEMRQYKEFKKLQNSRFDTKKKIKPFQPPKRS